MDPAISALIDTLRGDVATGRAALGTANRDGSHVRGTALAVVAPADADDVVALVRWARARRIPLVPRGAGTSLDGESVPVRGGVVVDLAGWNRILEVAPDEGWARVEPGVVNFDLQTALRPYDRFFPPNPGSWTTSTVGGNVGTNASGPRSFRYGATRGWVRSVAAVLGTGEVVRWGTRAPKRSVGPDLLSLFVGSEGTLGIATEITVRLAIRPAVREGWVVPLPSSIRLGRLASALAGAPGTGLSAVEYLDAESAAELSGSDGFDRSDPGALFLLEVEADSAPEARLRTRRLRAALRAAGVDSRADVFPDADALWTLRGRASVALDARVGERIREDVAVPLGSIDRLVAESHAIAEREGVHLYLFAHLGEGSLHPNFVVDPAGPVAQRMRASLLAASLALGGTISGEHGIGVLKPGFLAEEVGAPGLGVLRAVKRACDPDGILNPGKLYPPEPPRAARGSSRSPSAAAGGGARRG